MTGALSFFPISMLVGSRVGPFEIVAPLGAGGMGEVYRAHDTRIGRDVALKVLPQSVTADSDRLRRFEQEARAAGMLNHPNLLVVFDVGTHEGSPYIVSELLEGSTLRDVMTMTHLPLRKAVDYALQIANGLAAAHEKAIVHRDLKPENIFVTRDERVKLLDFGLAKLTADPDALNTESRTQQHGTNPGVVVGTYGYMSPEQVRGATVDSRSDIFSFGIVLYEMISGQNPFRRASGVETMNAILHDDPPSIAAEVMPLPITKLIQHALDKQVDRRFQSMKDIAYALDATSSSSESAVVGTKAKKSKRTERPTQPSFQRITFRRGFIMSARFAPDGSTVYGAAWEDKPLEVFASHPGSPEFRPLGFPDADVLSVSPSGELALSLGRRYVGGYVTIGTLARVPLGGGAPRAVCEDVQEAEWTADGKNLSIIRRVDGMHRIESPIGNVIYKSSAWISHARLSPRGDLIAFLEHMLYGDDGGVAVIVDRQGQQIVRSREIWNSTSGLAWTPKGDEIWVAGERRGHGRDLIAVSVAGKERVVVAVPGRLTLHDIAPNGNVLVSFENGRREAVVGRIGGEAERNISWFDWSWVAGVSHDGKFALLEEQASAVRGVNAIYLRPADGAPAVRISEGRARGMPISADGKWIVAETGTPPRLELLPVGPGQPRPIACENLETVLAWQLFPDGKRLLILGNERGEPARAFELPLDGDGNAKQISPEPAGWPMILSHDGQTVATMDASDRVVLFSITGTDRRHCPGCVPGDVPMEWSEDNRAIFMYQRGRVSLTIHKIDVTTGERTLWHTIRPADSAGILDIFPVHITPDGKTYLYGYRRFLSDLYLMSGLL